MSTPALVNYTNGLSQVSSDNLNTFFQTCTNMAQLRGFAGNNSAITVYVRGTTTANDGGQGTFYWNAGVTGTDDNGVTTVVPNGVTTGCWTRQQVSGSILLATSTTSTLIGTGSKTFIVSQSGVSLVAGGFVVIASRANVANYMQGQITSFSGNTLVVNVTNIGGSGTFADWNIIISGPGAAIVSLAFTALTSGTNATAAMLVGAGASLAPVSTGTIQANQLAAIIPSQVTYTASQSGAVVTLTDGATITADFSLANNFFVQLAGNRTLANPTNITQGESGQISIYQDSTGSRTLAYAWGWVFPGGSAPTLSTTGLYKDELCFDVQIYGTSVVTITIAAPGVVSWTAHGLHSGDRIQLSTTGALPTGLSVATTYWVVFIDANSFSLSSSLANAAAGTKITTSGSQSGVQTATAITINANLVKAFS